jgi:hypothetical protein
MACELWFIGPTEEPACRIAHAKWKLDDVKAKLMPCRVTLLAPVWLE